MTEKDRKDNYISSLQSAVDMLIAKNAELERSIETLKEKVQALESDLYILTTTNLPFL